MKEQIIDLLKKNDYSLSTQEIYDCLNLTEVDELKKLLKELDELEKSLLIYRTKKDKYMLFQNCHLKAGKFIANRNGYGFVDINEPEDIFIARSNINKAIHGDTVFVEIIDETAGKKEGKIVKIVDRSAKELVGEYNIVKNVGQVTPDDDHYKFKVEVAFEDSKSAIDGHKVLVKILNRKADNLYTGEITKVIGHKNDPGIDILSIACKYNINDEFSEEIEKELETIPYEVSEKEKKGRKDLTKKQIFTIDGADTKDIDDAISLDILANGNYLLGVHIADVSHYVTETSYIGKEALERGTSAYLGGKVIPMLPQKLSNGICSLNPNVERLAVSCEMEIDLKGNIVNSDIYLSIIKSKKQMTYDAVNKILEKNEVPEGYEEFKETLIKMNELAHILRQNKIDRGYIDFDIKEAKIEVNDRGEAIDIKMRHRGQGENLIEDFMIAANEAVASTIYYMELPFIYRVHGEPSVEKIQNFARFVSILGYKIEAKLKNVTPKTVQKILANLKNKKENQILSQLLLRSMQKAVYDKNNIGHFGIASKCYTHFTSPIRRFPDLTVHRLLKTYLVEQKINPETMQLWENKLDIIGPHSSKKERDAFECECEVDDMKMAEYMEKHIGEEYIGMISEVLSFGMFVELENLIEGLVRIDSLNDRYIFDEETFTIRSKKDKRGYRLGDRVRIKVIAANKITHKIDFEILEKLI
ncbi:MAG: ribonuclease R [Bacilli bacterium]|nr:ribonuclease R [Bacilli bacterium]